MFWSRRYSSQSSKHVISKFITVIKLFSVTRNLFKCGVLYLPTNSSGPFEKNADINIFFWNSLHSNLLGLVSKLLVIPVQPGGHAVAGKGLNVSWFY